MHLVHAILVFGLLDSSEKIWIFLLFPLVLVCPILWIGALVSCVRNEPSTGNTKIIWILLIIFLHIFGALAYFLIRRPQRIRKLGH